MADLSGYLPLGSVVLLKKGIHRVIIVGRGLKVKQGEDICFFDYAGVLYPEGLTGVDVCYFNNDWIQDIDFIGYNDESSRSITHKMEQYVASNPDMKRCPMPEEPKE